MIPAGELLPVNYYLENFQYLLDFVSRRYDDILLEEEKHYFLTFQQLPQSARQIYVRLVSRKGPLFRRDKLYYVEIEDIDAGLLRLQEIGWVDEAPDVRVEDLLDLLTKPELLEFASSHEAAISSQFPKAQVIASLSEALTVGDVRDGLPFKVIQPRMLEHLSIYRMLFFGNQHQDFTEFVLRDLGITPFEQYPLDLQSRLFDERCIVDQAMQLNALAELSEVLLPDAGAEALMEVVGLIPRVDDDKAILIRRKIGRAHV